MDITPLIPKTKLIIQRYGNGAFVLQDTSYEGNILIGYEQVLSWQGALPDGLTLASLQSLLTLDPLPELLLIGTGLRLLPLPPYLRNALRARHIAADVMDTGAACRTYNVLVAEERRVVAALIAV